MYVYVCLSVYVGCWLLFVLRSVNFDDPSFVPISELKKLFDDSHTSKSKGRMRAVEQFELGTGNLLFTMHLILRRKLL